MRARSLLVTSAAVVGSLLLLAACGGEPPIESGVDRAADRVTELEDAVDELARLLVTTTTAVPPPVTQVTSPPVSRPPRTTTTETTLAPDIVEASLSAVLALVGASTWDAELPIPRECVDDATFTPSGEGGINGGVITCTVDVPVSQVDEFFRFALARDGFAFSPTSGESSFTITLGNAATITGSGSGDRTSLTIEQRFN